MFKPQGNVILKENEMVWTSLEEKCFSSVKVLVKSYCQSGQLVELYNHLQLQP